MPNQSIPDEWMNSRIKDIAAPERNALVGGPFGSNLVQRDYTASGVPIIRGQNMGSGRWVSGEFVYVSQAKSEELAANTARPGDIVFTQRGTLGQVALVPETPFDRYIVSQSQMKLSVDRRKADPLFVYYVFSSHEMQEYVVNHAIQTGVPHTNLGILRDTPIILPPLPEQRTIAHILGTLDDKIELNRKMNQTLDEIARTLFTSWFVTFDPVRAKAEGRQPEGMDAETAALFPDRFVDSELGPIPEGWEVWSLDEIATFLNGLALQRFPPQGNGADLPVIKIAQLKKGSTEGADLASSEVPAAYIVDDGDVLFSWSGSLEAVIWGGGKGALNQHLFKVTSELYPKWFYYYWIHQHLPEFRGIAAGKATTMGHIQRGHLTQARVFCPPRVLLGRMDAIFAPLIDRFKRNVQEQRTLAEIRNTLLPELLSGEVRVRELEDVVGKAV